MIKTGNPSITSNDERAVHDHEIGTRGSSSISTLIFNGEDNPHLQDNSLYTRVFNELPGFHKSNPSTLFANARQSANQPVAIKRPREILTGVFSFDRPLINFQRKFAEHVNSEVAPLTNEDGYSMNGLHENMDSIKSIAGYPQTPVSALPRSNTGLLESLKIQARMTTWQREIAIAVWNRVWGRYEFTSVNIPKHSSTGPVRNINDAEYKLQYALKMCDIRCFNGMLKTFMAGDLQGLYDGYEIAPIMGTNVRWQVDRPGKQRYYWDIEDVIKDGSPNKRPITTKVVIEGQELSDFAAMRTRLVNAGPWTINVLLQMFATGVQKAMFTEDAATWHRDDDSIDHELSGKWTYFADVDSFDHSFSEEKIDLSLDVGRRYISSEIMTIASCLFYSAYFTRPLFQGGRPAMIGDPCDYLNKQVIAGNRSGHAFTSLFAKVWKVIDTLCKFQAIGHNVIDNIDHILKGQANFGIINNGDDEIVWFDSETDYTRFLSYVNGQPTEERMFRVVRENGAVYSGSVFQLVGQRQYRAIERLTTPFQRILCPERSINGNFRKAWPIGMLVRYAKRMSHDVLGHIWDIFDFRWREDMERYYGSFLGIIDRAYASLDLDATDFTWKELMVLEDPSKLHYRFNNDEIREEVRLSAFRNLPCDSFKAIIDSHYRGRLL